MRANLTAYVPPCDEPPTVRVSSQESLGDLVITVGSNALHMSRDWAEALHEELGIALTETS